MITGIISFPLFVILLSNTLGPLKSQETRSAHKTSLKRVFISVAGYLILVFFAGVPLMRISPEMVKFRPICEHWSESKYGGGKDIDNLAIALPNEAKIPILWYGIIAISHGLTSSLSSTITDCVKPHSRAIQVELDTNKIKDPNLVDETMAFYNSCYKPSLVRLFNNYQEALSLREEDKITYNVPGTPKPIALMPTYFKKEHGIDWLGSSYFMNQPGYYDTLKADRPVNRDVAIDGSYPTCKAWWEHSANGLYSKLIGEIPIGLYQKLKGIFKDRNEELYQENIVRKMIDMTFPSGLDMQADQLWSDKNFISKNIGSNMGLFWQKFSYYPKMYLLISSLPWIQALFLMGIYVFLPIILVFSLFRLNVVMRLSILIFSVTMLSYVWQLAGYIDDILINVLAPTELISDSTSFKAQSLIDMIALSLYIGLPMGWMYLMSNVTGGLMTIPSIIAASTSPSSEAGNKATSMTSTIASKAMMVLK